MCRGKPKGGSINYLFFRKTIMKPSIDVIKSEVLIHSLLNTHQNPKKILLSDRLSREESLRYDFFIEVVDSDAKNIDCAAVEFDENYLYVVSSLSDSGAAIFDLRSGDLDSAKEALEKLSPLFEIAMPFFIPYADNTVYIFCSKKYHPTSDLQLQRADMLDGLKFYTPYIQKAMFEQPKFFLGFFGSLLKN